MAQYSDGLAAGLANGLRDVQQRGGDVDDADVDRLIADVGDESVDVDDDDEGGEDDEEEDEEEEERGVHVQHDEEGDHGDDIDEDDDDMMDRISSSPSIEDGEFSSPFSSSTLGSSCPETWPPRADALGGCRDGNADANANANADANEDADVEAGDSYLGPPSCCGNSKAFPCSSSSLAVPASTILFSDLSLEPRRHHYHHHHNYHHHHHHPNGYLDHGPATPTATTDDDTETSSGYNDIDNDNEGNDSDNDVYDAEDEGHDAVEDEKSESDAELDRVVATTDGLVQVEEAVLVLAEDCNDHGNDDDFDYDSIDSSYDDTDGPSDKDDDAPLPHLVTLLFVDTGWASTCLQVAEEIDFDFVHALHTFVATVEGQANATKGDTMVLLDDSNSYWWLVRVVKDSSIGERPRRGRKEKNKLTVSPGYLPAEHVETPIERLARYNKHRNIDVCDTFPRPPNTVGTFRAG